MGIGDLEGDGGGGEEDVVSTKEDASVDGLPEETTEVEAKPDDGNIREAESSLQEGLSLNYEVRYLSFSRPGS